MEHLLIVKQDDKYRWACCDMPGGSCYKFTGMNIEVCNGCGLQRYKPVSKANLGEFLLDEELSKIIMAGANEGVIHWLFCTHHQGNLWEWSGCSMEGGCCVDILWNMDKEECTDCGKRVTKVLDHTGYTVGLDKDGQITIEKEP